MGAIAHRYREEVYRSTIWRSRLDNTTNSSIATSVHEFADGAAIGPIPGGLDNASWLTLTLSALRLDWRNHSRQARGGLDGTTGRHH